MASEILSPGLSEEKPEKEPAKITDFEYEKMEKFAVDLHYAKEDSEENLAHQSYTRWGLIEGEWIKIPEELRDSEEFKQYMIDNFEDEPLIHEDTDAQFFLRKTPESTVASANDSKFSDESYGPIDSTSKF